MIEIIPAILSTSEDQYKKDIEKVNKAVSLAEGWVHIDFTDNQFVHNLSVGPEVIEKYPTILKKEAHLMVSNPLKWIGKLHNAGFKRIIFHLESREDILACIESAKNLRMQVGLAIKNDTPVEKLKPFVDTIDIVLVMGVEPGFQGQPFISASLDKIRKIKKKHWKVRVAIDGSVKDTNAKDLVEAGADQLVVGSFLLRGEIDENIEKIWEAIQS